MAASLPTTKPTKPDATGASKGLYKDDIFETFVFWRSLPADFRGATADELKPHGIEDPLILGLFAIPTQADFAKRFKVHRSTLAEWNHRIDDNNLLGNARLAWAKRLTSNVVSALYKKATQEGDAPRVKLWHQLVEGWEEKSQATVTGLDDLSRAIKALAERGQQPHASSPDHDLRYRYRPGGLCCNSCRSDSSAAHKCGCHVLSG